MLKLTYVYTLLVHETYLYTVIGLVNINDHPKIRLVG